MPYAVAPRPNGNLRIYCKAWMLRWKVVSMTRAYACQPAVDGTQHLEARIASVHDARALQRADEFHKRCLDCAPQQIAVRVKRPPGRVQRCAPTMETARYATNRQITRIRTGQRSRNGVYLRRPHTYMLRQSGALSRTIGACDSACTGIAG